MQVWACLRMHTTTQRLACIVVLPAVYLYTLQEVPKGHLSLRRSKSGAGTQSKSI